jgi:hypothetical protein
MSEDYSVVYDGEDVLILEGPDGHRIGIGTGTAK